MASRQRSRPPHLPATRCGNVKWFCCVPVHRLPQPIILPRQARDKHRNKLKRSQSFFGLLSAGTSPWFEEISMECNSHGMDCQPLGIPVPDLSPRHSPDEC